MSFGKSDYEVKLTSSKDVDRQVRNLAAKVGNSDEWAARMSTNRRKSNRASGEAEAETMRKVENRDSTRQNGH